MFKKTLIAALTLAATTAACAADYYVVIPVKGKTTSNLPIQVTLAATSLPGAQTGTAYSFDLKPSLQVTGDPAFNPANVTWSVVTSSLPNGLALTAAGVLTGTPVGAGTSNFTVRATYKNKAGEQQFQLMTLAITVTLGSASLPVASPGSNYSYDFKPLLAVNGTTTYDPAAVTWTATGVPAGMTLSSTGVLAGTPPSLPDTGATVSVQASYKSKAAQQNYVLLTPGDPFWPQTVALLRMDGANGSTSFVDAAKGGTYTAVGAKISTAAAKFDQSGLFPGGNGQGVIGPAVSLPGDFTIEAWINPKTDGMTNLRNIVGQWSQQGNNMDSYLLGLNSGALLFYFGPNSVTRELITGPAVSANVWTHVAVTRQGSTFRMFVNGALVGSGVSTVAGPTIPTPMSLGDYYGTSGQFGAGYAMSFSGYMDEVRVTTASRYNANFTPPTVRFPAR